MNDIIIKTNELGLPVIKWNKNEIVDQVNNLTQSYQGLVLDAEQLPTAKNDLAQIRKVKTNLNDEKKRVKKLWNENYTTFENEIKEVMGQVDSIIVDIDTQVKEFESGIKAQRKNEIMNFEEFEAISEYALFNEDWLLKKWDDKKLKEEFNAIKEQIDSSINTLKMSCTTLNLNPDNYIEKLKTMTYEQVVQRLNEDYNLINKKQDKEEVSVSFDTSQPVFELTRTLKGTEQQLIALKQYAEKIGVEWIK